LLLPAAQLARPVLQPIAQADGEAKSRLKDFLEKRGRKVTRS